jgi:hypothetical protein
VVVGFPFVVVMPPMALTVTIVVVGLAVVSVARHSSGRVRLVAAAAGLLIPVALYFSLAIANQ